MCTIQYVFTSAFSFFHDNKAESSMKRVTRHDQNALISLFFFSFKLNYFKANSHIFFLPLLPSSFSFFFSLLILFSSNFISSLRWTYSQSTLALSGTYAHIHIFTYIYLRIECHTIAFVVNSLRLGVLARVPGTIRVCSSQNRIIPFPLLFFLFCILKSKSITS